MAGKRVKRREGNVLKIDLGGGRHAYAQVASDPMVVFFEGTFSEEIPSSRIVALPVLFRIWVNDDAIKCGRWAVCGNEPLSSENAAEPFYFKQDAITGALSIYHSSFADTGWERPASVTECENLECAAVWDPEHVEGRLRDHHEGRPNKWVESLKIHRRAFS